jgi:hypothetical protein
MPGKYRFYFSAAWLSLILAAAIQRVGRAFPAPGAELNSDARWVYLPNARKLLEAPWAFLTTDPASYHVAPLGYAWAAAWGADPVRTQLANSVLFLASVLLLWRCATRLGGLWAGVVATSLMVFNPELHSHIPQVLTESIFLFGLMLCLTAGVNYVLADRRRGLWLALAALGLATTLLSRPVLQWLALGALLLAVAATAALEYRRRHTPGRDPRWHRVVNRRLCLALAAALLLPAATVFKNGVFFGVWGMGTGAGTGLYYGVSPFKMGLEPVYSHFHYDAGATAAAAAPETRGNPLDQRADQVNARVALDIVRNTSLPDNLAFFTHKLRAWLLYSTPELQVSYKLRAIRLFEWLSIAAAAIVLASRWRRGTASLLPGAPGKTPEKLGILLVLLLLALQHPLQHLLHGALADAAVWCQCGHPAARPRATGQRPGRHARGPSQPAGAAPVAPLGAGGHAGRPGVCAGTPCAAPRDLGHGPVPPRPHRDIAGHHRHGRPAQPAGHAHRARAMAAGRQPRHAVAAAAPS